MGNRKAIVTLAIGEKYLEEWKRVCAANWQRYADKHGYDIICITEPLDNSERARASSPAWQKCLVLSQDYATRYERIVWLDADIIINHQTSPCITAGVPLEKVGAVSAYWLSAPEVVRLVIDRLYEFWDLTEQDREYTAHDYYCNSDLPADFDSVVRTGVLVLSPVHHRRLFEKVYYEYERTATNKDGEMPCLSYELLKADCVHWVDSRFDPVWLILKAHHYPFLLRPRILFKAEGGTLPARIKRKLTAPLDNRIRRFITKRCASTAFANNYFLHFQKDAAEMLLIDDA